MQFSTPATQQSPGGPRSLDPAPGHASIHHWYSMGPKSQRSACTFPLLAIVLCAVAAQHGLTQVWVHSLHDNITAFPLHTHAHAPTPPPHLDFLTICSLDNLIHLLGGLVCPRDGYYCSRGQGPMWHVCVGFTFAAVHRRRLPFPYLGTFVPAAPPTNSQQC